MAPRLELFAFRTATHAPASGFAPATVPICTRSNSGMPSGKSSGRRRYATLTRMLGRSRRIGHRWMRSCGGTASARQNCSQPSTPRNRSSWRCSCVGTSLLREKSEVCRNEWRGAVVRQSANSCVEATSPAGAGPVLTLNPLLLIEHYFLLTMGIPMQECAASFLSGFIATNSPWLRQFEANVTSGAGALTTSLTRGPPSQLSLHSPLNE